jgi:hypothetical protein
MSLPNFNDLLAVVAVLYYFDQKKVVIVSNLARTAGGPKRLKIVYSETDMGISVARMASLFASAIHQKQFLEVRDSDEDVIFWVHPDYQPRLGAVRKASHGFDETHRFNRDESFED